MMIILFNYINIIINYIYFIIDKIVKKYTKKQVNFNNVKKQVSFKDTVKIKLIPNNENVNKLLHVRQYMRIYDIEITESIYDYDLLVYFKSDKIV